MVGQMDHCCCHCRCYRLDRSPPIGSFLSCCIFPPCVLCHYVLFHGRPNLHPCVYSSLIICDRLSAHREHWSHPEGRKSHISAEFDPVVPYPSQAPAQVRMDSYLISLLTERALHPRKHLWMISTSPYLTKPKPVEPQPQVSSPKSHMSRPRRSVRKGEGQVTGMG